MEITTSKFINNKIWKDNMYHLRTSLRLAMTLEVEFLSGAVYQYFDVPQSIYDGLMAADSHGKYFAAYIKKGGYRYVRV